MTLKIKNQDETEYEAGNLSATIGPSWGNPHQKMVIIYMKGFHSFEDAHDWLDAVHHRTEIKLRMWDWRAGLGWAIGGAFATSMLYLLMAISAS